MTKPAHSWTDISRLNMPNRFTRPRPPSIRLDLNLTTHLPLIAPFGAKEIGWGQVVPNIDAPTVTYCSYCQENFDWPWPLQRRTYRLRCPTCGRDDDWCLTLPRWEFCDLNAGHCYVILERP